MLTPALFLEPFPLALADTERDPAIASPATLLGRPLGRLATTTEEIDRCLEAWAQQAPERLRLRVVGATPEGRALRVVEIAPRAEGEADERLPVWAGYTLHGSELSGSDAALGLIYQLVAGTDAATAALRAELRLWMAPVMNPDGRDRFAHSIRQHLGWRPSLDDQSLAHLAPWPRGCLNHYLVDLNRDWIFGTQPETAAWIREIRSLAPAVLLDAHEYGSHGTYLFSPSRAPFHPAFPSDLPSSWQTFAADLGAAFDGEGWKYCTGEWLEDWYPGYTTSWSAYLGAVPIIHEQSRVSAEAVRRPEGTVLSYAESVAHQLTSSWVNLGTARRHAARWQERAEAWRRREPAAGEPVAWAWSEAGSPARRRRLRSLLERQGLNVRDYAGKVHVTTMDGTERELGPGVLVVPRTAPWGGLADAILHPDPRFQPSELAAERATLERGEKTSFYDVTAWNPAQLAGAEVLGLREAEVSLAWEEPEPDPSEAGRGEPLAWLHAAGDDKTLVMACERLASGWPVRVARQAGELDGQSFARGALLIHRDDARGRLTGDRGHGWRPIFAGLGPQANDPAAGGSRWTRLVMPRVGLLTRWPTRDHAVGELWQVAGQRLGLEVSLLDSARTPTLDLRRYNVLLLPDLTAPHPLLTDATARRRLLAWLELGGTLIATGEGAAALAKDGLASDGARRLVTQLAAAVVAAPRPAGGVAPQWDEQTPDAVLGWGRVVPEAEVAAADEPVVTAWRPTGAILAARVESSHWLTTGLGSTLPVMVGGDPVLVPGVGAEVPVRLGVRVPEGWHLRVAGHVWPEAARRLVHTPVVVREKIGAGQVILFPGAPAWRGVAAATERLLANAIVLGPGCGTEAG